MDYCIAGQTLRVLCESDLFPDFAPYRIDEAGSLRVELTMQPFTGQEIPAYNGSGFLATPSDILCFREDRLLFGMRRSEEGFYRVRLHQMPGVAARTAIQYVLLLEGLQRGMLGMHAVTLECEGFGVLFSAPSGTGKTTHTSLWQREFGTEILNGDFAFLECTKDDVTFCGTPFSGSSPYARRGRWPVCDIVFLKQASENRIRRLSGFPAVVRTIENVFLPRWDAQGTKAGMDLVNLLLNHVNVWELECNMQPEAAHVAREAILHARLH